MTTPEPSPYIFTTSSTEALRLDTQNALIASLLPPSPIHPSALAPFETRLNAASTLHILDVGCGTACFLKDLFAHYPQGNFVALACDQTDRFVRESKRELPEGVRFVEWDVRESVPESVREKEGGWDVVNVRFLFSVVRKGEWGPLLERLRGLLSPTGHLQLSETTFLQAVESSYTLDRTSPPLSTYPHDPLSLWRMHISALFFDVFDVHRNITSVLGSLVLSAGFKAENVDTVYWVMPWGRGVRPREALRTSGPAFAREAQDEVFDFGNWEGLPVMVRGEDEDGIAENAHKDATLIAREWMKHFHKTDVPGLRTEEEAGEWLEAMLAWLDRHVFFSPAVWVAARSG